MFIVVINVALACTENEGFLERIQDTCKEDNGICNDAEMPFSDVDCDITTDSISCKGDRCVFKELWFAKLMIAAAAFLLIFHKKDYNIFLVVIGVLLILNFSSTGQDFIDNDLIIDIEPRQEMQFTESAIQGNIVTNLGSRIWADNPVMGFFIGIAIVLFVVNFLTKRQFPKRK